jgi:hypothetical protein
MEVFQKPDYQPLDRGEAFPQFHKDGDRYQWQNPMDWNYRFWLAGIVVMELKRQNTFDPMWLMGGEL